MRDLLLRLCELGWLKNRATALAGAPGAPGLVAQACRSALQHEFAEFARLVAVLESQV